MSRPSTTPSNQCLLRLRLQLRLWLPLRLRLRRRLRLELELGLRLRFVGLSSMVARAFSKRWRGRTCVPAASSHLGLARLPLHEVILVYGSGQFQDCGYRYRLGGHFQD